MQEESSHRLLTQQKGRPLPHDQHHRLAPKNTSTSLKDTTVKKSNTDNGHPSVLLSVLRHEDEKIHKQEHTRDVDDCDQDVSESDHQVEPLASHALPQGVPIQYPDDVHITASSYNDSHVIVENSSPTMSFPDTTSSSPITGTSDPAPVIKANASARENANSHSAAHSRALAAGLLSAVLLLLLLVITAAVLILRRRRRSRHREMCDVLDKVTTPPPRPDRSRFSNLSLDAKHDGPLSSQSSVRAPTIDIPVVPALDIQRLHEQDLDLEANERHSAELSHQKVVGQRVRSDMSFSWQFPKLSVPPAAVRALQSAHYVKKRNTIPSPPSNYSMTNANGSPSLSLSSAAELAFGTMTTAANASSSLSNEKRTAHETSMTMSCSSQSAVPSSSYVDPVIDVASGSFIAARAGSSSSSSSSIRTRWWSSSLQGFRHARQSEVRCASRSTTISLSGLSWHSQPAITPDPVVLAVHDPILQDVMAHVLSLVAGQDASRMTAHSSERSVVIDPAFSVESSSQHISSGQRRASRAPSMLETCRESSQERLEVITATGADRLEDFMPDSPTDSIVLHTPPPRKERSLSEAYSAHSIIVHDISEEEKSVDRHVAAPTHTVQTPPNARQSRNSITPKILLTSTAEDGSLERQLSMTSFETSTRGSHSSASSSSSNDNIVASESDDSMEFAAYADHSMLPTSRSRPHDDIADAIGQAFMAHMSTERQIARKRSTELPSSSTLMRARNHRESDSTIDSLSTFSRHRQDVLIASDSFEGAFNDAFSEAASARSSRSSESLTDDRDEDGSDNSTVSFDETSIVTARPESMTQSESGIACLIDDDFPTIPTWKSISTQKSFATATTEEAATIGWRSASSMSIATIRPPQM